MVRDLAGWSTSSEKDLEMELEEAALVTLGFGYEKRPRLSGGAYAGILRKVDGWIDGPLSKAIPERERRAGLVLELDDAVTEAVAKLRERGMQSPYLKAFVVARANPLRFIKGDLPSLDSLMATMTKRIRGMKVEGVKVEDLARSGGAPDEE
jgi:ParB family chromosome partitioning protein